MSWNGTVRCSWCHNKGHNRRSCPELKKYAEENPDGWAAQQLKRSKQSAQNRRCRYCGEQGHNRRTCTALKADKKEYRELCVRMRREALAWIKKNGAGPGALVAFARHNGPCDKVGLVRSGSWWWIGPARCDHRLTTSADPTELHPFLGLAHVLGVGPAATPNQKTWASNLKVLSPVPFNEDLLGLPKGWKEGCDEMTLDARENHFKEHSMYSIRRWTLRQVEEIA